jgi:hypothetical protein
MFEEKSETEDVEENGQEPTEERLEKLEEHIEQAKREGDEAMRGSFYEGEPDLDQATYVESGDEARKDPSEEGAESKSDDQTIAP